MSGFVVDRPQRGLTQSVALITALTIVMSATGACDTDSLGLIHRTSLWLVISALVVLQALAVDHYLRQWLAHDLLRRGAASAATILLTTLELHLLKFTPFLPKEPDPPLEFLIFVTPLAGPMALLALTLIRDWSKPAARPPRAEQHHAAGAGRPEQEPPQTIVRITAEDHYLRVYTADGSRLIRGRMKDALSKLAPNQGIQIHRSHWVATEQIVRVVRSGRDYRAVLSSGDSLPIGRSRVSALRPFIDTP